MAGVNNVSIIFLKQVTIIFQPLLIWLERFISWSYCYCVS